MALAGNARTEERGCYWTGGDRPRLCRLPRRQALRSGFPAGRRYRRPDLGKECGSASNGGAVGRLPVRARTNCAGKGNAEADRTGTGVAEPGRAEVGRTEPPCTKASCMGAGCAEGDSAEVGRGESGRAETGRAE